MKTRNLLITTILLTFQAAALGQEQGPSPVEAQLRETLRNTMIQLRNVQAEKAAADAELQAVKVQSEAKIKDLEGKLAESIQRGTTEREAADKALAEKDRNLAARDARIESLEKSLKEWQDSHAKIKTFAETTVGQLQTVAADLETTRLTLEKRTAQNAKLYQVGSEVLERYKDFALGRALIAREPFTGLARVQIEAAVADYKDQLVDEVAEPDAVDEANREGATTADIEKAEEAAKTESD
ncbi:MAG: hypothetical protein KDN19_18575 [Verrucomicrobiae bacterium]|nr:hypothetical protein [Verrucomicrobiae bacterium]